MRALMLALCVASFAVAAPLTKEESAEGWLQLVDGETTMGWIIEGEAKVDNGKLLVGGEKETTLKSKASFGDFAVEIRFESGNVRGTAKASRTGNGRAVGKLGDLSYEIAMDGHIIMKVPAGKSMAVTDVRVKLANMKSLFNGKDLSGWKVYPGAKDKKVSSKFTVTPEGWLNVKDGPGDLQTEDEWDDFVVQLECISNGTHLNSGLFFRCIPNQYQQGYEAQIRNQWEGEDRSKPVDFGTGAIYRRQAARKVVATDKEWFTLTVYAKGRQISTWVDGYPVVDWADDRKESENARQGFKAGKGALSIQGHDPTTDLSFRNIRIQSR